MPYQIDLNSDLGESFGAYGIGLDTEVIQHITSANIACGYHAGDPLIMDQTVAMAKKCKVAVGAHPGFPDLMGFGRRALACSPKEVTAYIQYQLGALMAFASAHGLRVQHCKPHGALYNMAGKDPVLAQAIAEGVAAVDKDIILLGLAGSCLLQAGQQAGLRVASEVFADRAYLSDGSLAPRGMQGAVLHDQTVIARRALRMIIEGVVETITGEIIPLQAHSVCVHGDNPAAAEAVRQLRAALAEAGISVVPLSWLV